MRKYKTFRNDQTYKNNVPRAVAYIDFHFEGGRLCILFLGGREGGSTLLRKKLLFHYKTS
jgi:hypothetical protein